MALITDSITYNVHERGRKTRGQDRNFDTAALAALINSSAIQEQVKHGDMMGYYGHWPRIKFGMQPVEGGIIDGKAVPVTPALRTIELSATKDGTITHRTEFLDTVPGKIAAQLFSSKAGGWSSAIDAVPRTSPSVPRGFYGFDYVLEPNYSTNRGHKVILDGVGAEAQELLDCVLAEAAVGDAAMAAMFDSLMTQHRDALETLDRIARENDGLIDRLMKASSLPKTAILDSLSLESVFELPGGGKRVDLDAAEQFRTVALERLDQLPAAASPPSSESRYLMSRYGVKF